MSVTLKQIAELAGVSRGTVDRALYNRGRVNPEVAKKIKQIAEDLGYQPNRAGRALALAKNPLKIGVIVQSIETPFIQQVIDGISVAKNELSELGVMVIVKQLRSVNINLLLETIDNLIEEGVNGISLLPANDEIVSEKLNKVMSEYNIPIVTFNSDVKNTNRLCFVGLNNALSGKVCAGLMYQILGEKGKILVITGHLTNHAHNQRVEGFSSEIQSCFNHIELLPLEACFDDDEIAERIVERSFREIPDINGIFVAANGQQGVCSALERLNLTNKVKLICYDLTPQNKDFLLNGSIDFLIGQNAFEQGYTPIKILFDFLFAGKKPEASEVYTDIVIKTKYII